MGLGVTLPLGIIASVRQGKDDVRVYKRSPSPSTARSGEFKIQRTVVRMWHRSHEDYVLTIFRGTKQVTTKIDLSVHHNSLKEGLMFDAHYHPK